MLFLEKSFCFKTLRLCQFNWLCVIGEFLVTLITVPFSFLNHGFRFSEREVDYSFCLVESCVSSPCKL